MEENYGGLVSPKLISKWESDPANAPGREVSSPWPDRIEISSIDKITNDSYSVKGDIIEVTSVEEKNGGAAAKRPIELSVVRNNKGWIIDDVILGAYSQDNSIVDNNTKYGFDFTLPSDWKGFTIVESQWQGTSSQNGQVVATGPLISIRNPKWTS
jgi:hypothetical protein